VSGANDNKTHPTYLRLTEAEGDAFKRYCEARNVKRARLLRKIVRELINGEPDLLLAEQQDFRDATLQLAGIARNFNQLTRAVNRGKVPKQLFEERYFQELIHSVRAVRRQLDRVMDATAQRWVNAEREESQ
jgi:hypothetical protein